MSMLSKLVGQTLSSISSIHDYWYLRFSSASMCVYSPLSLDGIPPKCNQIIEVQVLKVDVSDDLVSIQLCDYRVIAIDLNPSNQAGPEFVTVQFDDGTIVVCN